MLDMRVDHVAVAVSDLKQSVEWYEQYLGCKLKDEYHSGEWHIAVLKLGEFEIELIQLDETNSLPEYRESVMSDIKTLGVKHFAIIVDDLDKTIRTLEKRGVEIAHKPEKAGLGGWFAFIKDCDGILIELNQK